MRGLEVQFRPEHTEIPARLGSEDDVDTFIDALLSGQHDRSCAVVYSLDRPMMPSGYWDHELSVGVDRVAQVGALTLAVDDGYVSKGQMDRGIGEYMLLGHVREFMPGSEIPIDLVREAVKEFLVSGGQIPMCIEWQTEEF
ncbi:Imm1 family immunity protein [Streptomyces sp. BK022]|uniref:Imm1 family immunity protein n=1 Tax=Streptomyces sp. BK022 TaxID=2512123 RepID=UPI001029DDC7|nr:Imm1 family immunity protein [Streptomyces sp. BK022]